MAGCVPASGLRLALRLYGPGGREALNQLTSVALLLPLLNLWPPMHAHSDYSNRVTLGPLSSGIVVGCMPQRAWRFLLFTRAGVVCVPDCCWTSLSRRPHRILA